jgi:hypothetical protein
MAWTLKYKYQLKNGIKTGSNTTKKGVKTGLNTTKK